MNFGTVINRGITMLKNFFVIMFAPVTIPYYLGKKALNLIGTKNDKYPKTAKSKTWTLIAVWSFFSIGLTAIFLDSIFGLAPDGTSKEITYTLTFWFTLISSVLIYISNPFKIIKNKKTRSVTLNNFEEKEVEIQQEEIKIPVHIDLIHEEMLEKYNVSKIKYNQAMDFYNRPIFKKQLNPTVREDLYTIETNEFKLLNDLGLVSQEVYYPHIITISTDDFDLRMAKSFTRYEKNRTVKIPGSNNLNNIQNGLEFEEFVAKLLGQLDYKNVRLLPASGDYGVDILAEKDSFTYAVQCKFYSSPVSLGAVQEVRSGQEHYNASVGIVVTNNFFTQPAKNLAKSARIGLWDGNKLKEMIEEASQ